MRQTIYAILVFLCLCWCSSQAQERLIQGTVKPGATADEVEVWLRPNFDSSTTYLYQIGLPIAFPAGASPQPTGLTYTFDPDFIDDFGSNYVVTVNPVTTAAGGTEKYFNIVLVRGGVGASNPQTWTSGTEFRVLTATFTYAAGTTSFSAKLADYQDGGGDGQGNFYTQSGATYFVTTNSVGNFYGVPGFSVAGGNAAAGYAQINTVLPVRWGAMSARSIGGEHRVQWGTVMEQNCQGFEVQRSTNGADYQRVGYVASAAPQGNSGLPLQYEFEEAALAGGPYYYRLRQLDLDGHSNFSPALIINASTAFSLGRLQPNPSRGPVYLSCQSATADQLTLDVVDLAGRTLLTRQLSIAPGNHQLPLDFSSLSRGSYFIRFNSQRMGKQGVQQWVRE